jgi:two-component system NarL family sensor kinase
VDVVLSVEDDGKGFEPNTKNNGSTGGNGLGNMQKRTAEMNGTLSISSSPGVGTTVTLRFRNNPAKSLDPMIADRNTPR